jgi:hypothetical protein
LRGSIVTANNAPFGSDSKYKMGRAFAPSFRAYQIQEQLSKFSDWDLKKTKEVQCDTTATDAVVFVPMLLKALESGPDKILQSELEKQGVLLLSSWDYKTGLECRACGVYRAWMEFLLQGTQVKEVSLFRYFENPALSGDPEGWLKQVREAFSKAVVWSGLKPWKELHKIAFRPFSQIGKSYSDLEDGKAFSEYFSTPGDNHSINMASGAFYSYGIEQRTGASHRLLIELGSNEVKVELSMTTRNKQWMDCEYEKIEF